MIRKNKVVLFLGIFVLLNSCKEKKNNNENTESAVAQENTALEPAADSLYQDIDGNAIALEDYKGKRLVLNYWATWCKPCIEEMPAMARAQKLLTNDNYVFLFASNQSFKKIRAFKEQRQFDLEFIKFNGAYADLQITALPVTLIYNEAGAQVARYEGGMIWDTPQMIEELKLLH